MTILEFLHKVRKNAVIFAICVFISCAIGAVVLTLAPREYSSTSGTYFAAPAAATTTELSQGTTLVTDQLKSFAFLARSDLVLSRVTTRLGLPQDASQLSDQIVISIPPGTLVMEITVKNNDPNVAAAMANEIALQLNEVVPSVSGSLDGSPTSIRGVLVDPAKVSSKPSSPSIQIITVISVLIGVLLGIVSSIARDSGFWHTNRLSLRRGTE